MSHPLAETWAIHNRIHLYLLDAVSEEAMQAVNPPKSRTVFELFAHIHNVRLMWLKSAAPDLLENTGKIDVKKGGTRDELAAALQASGSAVEKLLLRTAETEGRIKGFKPHATAFLGYLISHESHHRGHIEWALKYGGFPLDDKTHYGLWEWGAR
jgi:uncharacterized damage-inducible protein DinB